MRALKSREADGVAFLSARRLFGSEMRRLRQARQVTQEQLAALVVHSRALVAAVELGERWPPRDLAVRCDEVLGRGDDLLTRLWPLVDAERQAARMVIERARLSDLREAVLRLAVLTGTDLSVLGVDEAEPDAPDAAEPSRREVSTGDDGRGDEGR